MYTEFDKKKSNNLPYLQNFLKKNDLTWNEFLAMAGIDKSGLLEQYTKDDLVTEIQRLAKEIQHTPSISKFVDETGIDRWCIRFYFGNFATLIKAAGLRQYYKTPAKVCLDKEALKNIYVDLSRELGKEKTGATRQDIDDAGLGFCCDVFAIRFGGINDLRIAYGMKPARSQKKYTKIRIAKMLLQKQQHLGRRPTKDEIDNDKSLPACSTILRYFRTSKFSDVWREITDVYIL